MKNSEEHEPKQRHHLIEYANGPSLEEINGTIDVPKNMSFWKRFCCKVLNLLSNKVE
ncbi:hypothetical protein EZ063_15265 [Enterococcus faecalis]|uniref:hypothetical protein n=1 Tax=Enterococcus faecalis TaxID=1351 RepID=UPI0012E0D165|nr:hypothetical protein [Enterococcus faecalis]MUO12638.1 hypothetical protein [Enterococcus faecalis]